MKNITAILKTNSTKREAKAVQTAEDFKAFAHKQLKLDEAYDVDVATHLIDNLLNEVHHDINQAMEGLSMFTQSFRVIKEDVTAKIESKPFFVAFDYLSVFDALYDLWLEYNTKTWYSTHISDAIDKVKDYVDQYASHVSVHHSKYKSAQLNIEDAESILKNKQFAGIIKRSAEWKELKNFLKKFDVNNAAVEESAAGAAILKTVFKEIHEFVKIVSSK